MRLALACLLSIVASNASAAPIPYSFAAEIDGFSNPVVSQQLGVGIGDMISGSLYFDDTAPQTSFSSCIDCGRDGTLVIPGVVSDATYDVARLGLSVAVGNATLDATGTTLRIHDEPTGTVTGDLW